MRLALFLIIALLCLTRFLPEGEPQKANSLASPSKAGEEFLNPAGRIKNDSFPIPFYSASFALLRLSAGKKAGYTQQEMDSLRNIISLRKKF